MQMMGNPKNNVTNDFNGLLRMLKSGNPEEIARQMMQSNPQFRSFMQQNQGKSPEQVAKEHGIDISKILDGFK